MSWATHYIAKLIEGEIVVFRPRGNSMTPIIKSKQEVEVAPFAEDEHPFKGQVVLCKVGGKQFLHKVTAIKGDQYQISNNHGHVNGWTKRENIYGYVSRIG